MSCFKTAASLVAFGFAICAASADAALIRYSLIDIQPSGGRTEIDPPGIAIPGTPSDGTNGTDLSTTGLLSDTGDAFTIAIDDTDINGNDAGGIDWRDRGNSTSTDPYVRLAEDFIKNNSGIIRVTLGSLPMGNYTATSFHLDPDFDQSGDIDVFISTDGGTTFGPSVASGNSDFSIGGENNLTEANILATSATFNFSADGVNDVVLLFDGSDFPGDSETPLNGLDIFIGVPEPSTLLLAGLGLLGLAFRRRARR